MLSKPKLCPDGIARQKVSLGEFAHVPINQTKELKLSHVVPPFILGASAFSPQINSKPEEMPIEEILGRALSHGFRGFDTSPYYGESEVLLGRAFEGLRFKGLYRREDVILMTKAGRVSANRFDYSRQGVISSVHRSMQRLNTHYLDVVFCHDVEFVSEEEALEAVNTLFSLADAGYIRYVGISGYPLEVLLELCRKIKNRYGRQVDAVQTYGHFTIQNTDLETYVPHLRDVGVDVIFSASPLAIGLLRKCGVPIGDLGDFHPAPKELRLLCQEAAEWVESQGDDLAALATRFACSQWKAGNERTQGGAAVILGGCSSIEELDKNARSIQRAASLTSTTSKGSQESNWTDEDDRLVLGVKSILKEWCNYCWESPGSQWDRDIKATDV